MEDSSNHGSCPPGEARTSSMSGSRLSHPLEKLHSQTDSFLTAARLIRRGLSDEGKNTGGQEIKINSHRTPPSKVDGGPGPKRAEVNSEEPTESRQVPAVVIRRMAESSQAKAENREDKGKQTIVLSVDGQRGSKTGLYSQTGIICVRVSGCRSACRRSRRFKPPILPVIAEM